MAQQQEHKQLENIKSDTSLTASDLVEANRRLKKQAEQLAILNQMSVDLNEANSIAEVFEVAADKIGRVFAQDRVSLALLSEDSATFEVFAVSGMTSPSPVGDTLPVENTGLWAAVQAEHVLHISDPANSEFIDTRRMAQKGIASILITPLYARGRAIGTINFGSTQPNAYDAQDEALALQVAALLATTIDNQRLLADVTNRAEELEENTRFLDSIVENLPNMVFVKDATDLAFVRFNKAGEQLLGVDRTDLLGKTDYDLFAAEDADTFTAKDRAVLAQDTVLDIPQEKIETAHQGTRVLHTLKVPIADRAGDPKYLLGISEDITARVDAEEKLHQQQARLAQANMVVENSPVVLFRWRADENWSVEYVSENVAQFGYTPQELISGETPYASLVHPDDLARVAQEVADYSAGGVDQFTQEYRIVTRDGQVRWTDDRTVIERDEAGNITHYQGIVIDITEQKENLLIWQQQTERLAQLNEMSTALNEVESLEEIYQIVGRYTQTILGGDRASLGLVDPDGQTFEIFGLSGLNGAIPMGLHLPVEGTGVGLAIQENRVAAFPQEASLDAYKDTSKLAADGIQCTISAPLEVSGQVIGTLNVASKTADAFGDQEISLIQQITAVVSSAMQAQRLLEQMKVSEARFRDVALSSGDWVWEVDANGVYTYCSDRVVDVLGYKPEELVGKTPFDFMVPGEVEQVGQIFGELIAAHQPIEELENRNLTKDGREVILATSGVPVLDDDGQLLGYRGVDRDITARKRAEDIQQELTEALQQERTTLEAILEGLPLGVFVVEAPTGRPIITNSGAAELLGQGIDPNVEKSELAEVYQAYRYGTDELYPPEEMPLVRGMAGENATVEDMEIRKPNGERHLLRVFGAPIKNNEGEITSSVAIFQDITEQKKAELQLQKNQERLAEATAIAKLYYWEFDVATQKFAFSPEYFKALNIPITDETDFTMTAEEYTRNYIPPEEAELVGQRVGAALTSTEAEYSSESEASNLTTDGRHIPVMVRFKLVRDEDGNPSKLVGANQDITEQKEAEEALAKQAEELQTVADLSTRVATTRDTKELLQEVVDLTKERFGLYHAHIYLLNEAGDTLELTAGADEAGRTMVSQGWSIPYEREHSLVAQTARRREGVIVNDVQANPDFMANPLLPDTRAEMAVPLLVGERLLGVLDVQADITDRFTEQDVQIKTTLASQVAVALENARLFERSENTLKELNALTNRLTREGWSEYLDTLGKGGLGYSYDRQQLVLLESEADAPLTEANCVQPIQVRGEVIGQLLLDEPQTFTDEAEELVSMVAQRLSNHVESLRLTEQTQAALAEQQKTAYLLGERMKELDCLNDIGREVSETPPIDTFLQWVADRIPPAMQYPDVCMAAIEFGGQVYGDPSALATNIKIVNALRVTNQVVGRIHIAYQEPREFLDEESALLGGIASRVGGYLESRQLLDRIQEALSGSQALYRASQVVGSLTDMQSTLQSLAEVMVERLEYKSSWIAMIDEESQMLKGIAGAGVGVSEAVIKQQISLTEGARNPSVLVATQHRPLLINDVAVDERTADLPQDIRQALGRTLQVPIMLDQLPVGVVAVNRSMDAPALTDQDLELITAVAGQAAVGIQNARLLDQIRTSLAEQENLTAQLDDERSTLQAVLDNLPAGVFVLDTEGHPLIVNKYAEQLLGRGIAPDANEDEITEIYSVYRAGTDELYPAQELPAVRALAGETSMVDDQEVRKPNGEITYMEVYGAPVRNPAGDIIAGLAIGLDVTDRKQAETEREQLLLDVQRLASIVENHPDFIGVGSLDGQAQYVNPAGLRMIGLTTEHDVTTMEAVDFYPKEDAEMLLREAVPEALEKGAWSAEARLLRRDGSIIPVEETIGINYDAGGQPTSFSITMRDITDRKAAEEERERLLAEVESAYRQYVSREWSDYLQQASDGRWRVEHQPTGTQQAVSETGSGGNGHSEQGVSAPISLRGQQIGQLRLEDIDPNRTWTEEEKALLATVSEQLALTVENLRLFDDTQQRATREQITRQITDKMRASANIDSIIQVGVEELAKVLGGSHTIVELSLDHQEE